MAGAEPAARAQPRAVRVSGAGRGGALLGVPLGGGGGARALRHRRHHHRERRPGPRRRLPRPRLLPRRGRGALPQDRGQRIQVHIPHCKVIIIIHQMKHFIHHVLQINGPGRGHQKISVQNATKPKWIFFTNGYPHPYPYMNHVLMSFILGPVLFSPFSFITGLIAEVVTKSPDVQKTKVTDKALSVVVEVDIYCPCCR